MKFKINNIEWEIKLESQEKIKLEYNENIKGHLLGICKVESSLILISNELVQEKLYKTAIHELTHSFLFEYLPAHFDTEYDYEDIADIISTYGEEIISVANKFKEETK